MQRKEEIEEPRIGLEDVMLRRRNNVSCESTNEQHSMERSASDKPSQHFELQTENIFRENLQEVDSIKNDFIDEEEDEQELSASIWEKLSSSDTNEDLKQRCPIIEEQHTSEPFVDFSKYEMTTELSHSEELGNPNQRLRCVSKQQQSIACSATLDKKFPCTCDYSTSEIDLKLDTLENSSVQQEELRDQNNNLIQTEEEEQSNVDEDSPLMSQVAFYIILLLLYGLSIWINVTFIDSVLNNWN